MTLRRDLGREEWMRRMQLAQEKTAPRYDPLFESLRKAIAAEEAEARTSRAAKAAG